MFLPEGQAPALRNSVEKVNLCALGGYELYSAQETPRAVIFAAGQPLAAALEAAQVLEQGGVPVRLVSLPAPRRLLRQEEERRERIIGAEETRVLAAPHMVARLWAPMLCEDGVVGPCDARGRLLDTQALATLIRRQIRAGLDATLLDTARQSDEDAVRNGAAEDE